MVKFDPSPLTHYPTQRLRRLRKGETLRRLVRETQLSIENFIYPLLVRFGNGVREEIPSMPGQYRLSLDQLPKEVEEVSALGIPALLLFGIPEEKDGVGSGAYAERGIIQEAVRRIKDSAPDLIVITDLCMCGYTDHGHCGIVRDGQVLNDETLELLGKIAVSQAAAGADIVAPSGMMDGQVKAVRRQLDSEGFYETAILSYASKYASAFYGPFREAAASTPQFGDRRGYQMDPANGREALREMELDIAEGADLVMVKPALAYLDVLRQARERFNHPIAAYNVSGEYAMVKAAAQKGWIDEKAIVLEILTAIKRAGADLIISYFAKDVARWLREDNDK
ncbi:porphobilinogen synthase [candidate division TA06 bacterium]|nr:porphobilinogen synthase [candidate division TA06 bacterium]